MIQKKKGKLREAEANEPLFHGGETRPSSE